MSEQCTASGTLTCANRYPTQHGRTVYGWIGPAIVSCSLVQLSVDSEAHYQAAHYLLPALARLHSLSSLQLRIGGNQHALTIATLLLSIRTQLTNLRSLQLTAADRWTEAALAWLELGRFTRLEKLDMEFSLQALGAPACSQEDLQGLSALKDLHILRLLVPAVMRSVEHPVTLQTVTGMHQLTPLEVSLGHREGLAAHGPCISLQSLTVTWSAVAWKLQAADWAVVGQLTGLTKLALLSQLLPRQSEACAACCAALEHLMGLRELHGHYWRPVLLPALQQLSQLSHIRGGWLLGDLPGVATTVALPQVVCLSGTFGTVPCRALPGLQTISWKTPCKMGVDVLTDLSSHCCMLQVFETDVVPARAVTIGSEGPQPLLLSARVDAISGMSRLVQLTRLQFAPHSNAEMIAFAAVVAALTPHNLRVVDFTLVDASSVIAAGLIHLAAVMNLDIFTLWF